VTGRASTSRVRRIRIRVALWILPRDWQAAGPAQNPIGRIESLEEDEQGIKVTWKPNQYWPPHA
jgi:hypothetical protein